MAQNTAAAHVQPRNASLLQQTHCTPSKKNGDASQVQDATPKFHNNFLATDDRQDNAARRGRLFQSEEAQHRKNAGTRRRSLHPTDEGFAEKASVSEVSDSGEGAAPSDDAARAGEFSFPEESRQADAAPHSGLSRRSGAAGVFTGQRRTSKGTVLRMLSSSASSSSR